MPKKKDENEIAFAGLQELMRRDAKRDGLTVKPIAEPEKLSYRVEAGRKGGKIGGKARLIKMTPEKREEVARQAAKKRWSK